MSDQLSSASQALVFELTYNSGVMIRYDLRFETGEIRGCAVVRRFQGADTDFCIFIFKPLELVMVRRSYGLGRQCNSNFVNRFLGNCAALAGVGKIRTGSNTDAAHTLIKAAETSYL